MPLLIVALTTLLAAAGGTDADASAPALTPAQKTAQDIYQNYSRSLLQSLRNSTSPRDRAMATQMGEMADLFDGHKTTPTERAERGATLRAAAQAAPTDVLVQWLWMEASPEDSGCTAASPCPDRVEAVSRLQPENGSAWVPVVSVAWEARNIPAAESALAKMAHATRFDEQFSTALKAWMDMYQRFPVPRTAFAPGTPEAQLDQQTFAFSNAFAYATAIALPAYQAPVDACNRDKHPEASQKRFRDCAQAGRSMLTLSSSLIDRLIGRTLLRVSGQATAEDIANARVLDWQYGQWQALVSQQSPNDLAFVKELATDWLETGDEFAILQRRLQRKGIPLSPPTDWQPSGPDGKPISPLGASSANPKQQ